MLSRKTSFLLLLLILILIGLGYGNHFHNAFHFDDTHSIQDNPYIQSLGNIPRFFHDRTTSSSMPSHQGYRPLVTTTLAIDYAIGQSLDPLAFHVTNFLGFLLVTLLIFPLFNRLLQASGGRKERVPLFSLAALVFFGFHAANAETVNYIIARSDILVALAQMLSFVIFLRGGWGRLYFLYLIPAVAGLFAKESGIMVVPTFLTYFFLFEEHTSLVELLSPKGIKSFSRSLVRGLPLIVVCGFTFWFTVSSGQYVPGGDSTKLYAMTQPFVLILYSKNFLLPLTLSADTDLSLVTTVSDWRFAAGVIFLVSMIGLLILLSRSPRTRAGAFGLSWYLLTLVPSSSIVPLAEPMNDHRTFLSYIGLLLFFTNVTEVLSEKRFSGKGLALCLLPLLFGNIIVLRERNEVWKTEESLWKNVTITSPMNGRGWMNYGLTQMTLGRYEEAKVALERARQLTPNYATLWVNLGVLQSVLGLPMQAEEAFLFALRLGREEVEPYVFYARFLENMGRSREAESVARQALSLYNAHLGARIQLLDILYRSNNPQDYRTLLAETQKLFPGNQAVLDFSEKHPIERIGVEGSPPPSEQVPNEYQASIAASLDALRTPTQHAEAYNNICAANIMLKQYDEAMSACKLAIRANPRMQIAQTNLRRAEEEKAKAMID